MLRSARVWFCTLILASQLTACQKVRVEEDPSERAQATAVAEKYLRAFASMNAPLILEMSSMPFWGDGDVIEDIPSFTQSLREQFAHAEQLNFKMLETEFLTLEQLAIQAPDLYTQVLLPLRTGQAPENNDHHDAINSAEMQTLGLKQYLENLYAVRVVLAFDDGGEEEGIVLMRRQPDGMWKVAGIGE